MYSDNIGYARQRLVGTIVMWSGEPVYVDAIDEDGMTHCRYLKNNDDNMIHVDDLDLVGQNKLGYINYGNSSYHMVRKPMRNDWRQGLRTGNMAFSGPEGFYELPFPQLRATILGLYPSFQEASKLVTEGVYEKRAFSRNFAVQEGRRLLYKERWVGNFDKFVTLQERFKYLNEYLNDILGGQYAED